MRKIVSIAAKLHLFSQGLYEVSFIVQSNRDCATDLQVSGPHAEMPVSVSLSPSSN